MTPRAFATVILTAAATALAGGAGAAELVYRPLNPSFGGNPNYSGHLIGLAQIQNQYTGGSSGGSGGAPQINFPPITIDLGGVGGGGGDTTPDETTDPTAPTGTP